MPNDKHYPVKAYKNDAFIEGHDGRPMRILAEYLEPESRFERLQVRDTIVFFGSARIASREAALADLKAAKAAKANSGDTAEAEMRVHMSRYYEDAREMSRRLTEWSKALEGSDRRFVICTGGGPGIMEAASRGASEAKGINIGLSISLPQEEFQNPYVTRELSFEFHYFFIRKFWFAYLAKAVIAMPGGFGTLDEFFELMTLIQTLKMKKRLPVVLFGAEFWDDVIDLKALVKYGTISADDLDLFFRTDSVDEAVEYVTRELSAHAMRAPGAQL